MAISAALNQIKDDVLRIYEELDAEIEKFKSASALKCASGCGRCCENPKIFITVLEVLPLAYEFWQKGIAETTLTKISDLSAQTACIFYQPDPLIAGNGRCGVYQWRPLLCRLFGYAAILDKYGCPQLVTCPTMKTLCAKEYQLVVRNLDQRKIIAPLMQDYMMRLFNIDPHLGREQFPINVAVKIALEKIGLLNAS